MKPKDYKLPKEFENKYWYAVGGTDIIKELLTFLNSQEAILKKLVEAEEARENPPI